MTAETPTTGDTPVSGGNPTTDETPTTSETPTTGEYASETGMTVETLGSVGDGTVDLMLQRVVLEPGGSTGWHFHTDHVWGYVAEGTLTHEDHTGAVDGEFTAGQYVVEGVGPATLHLGTNRGTGRVVLYSARFDRTPT